MIKAIEEILNQFSNEIGSKKWSIEGFDLSYVDHKEKYIEIFSFSTDSYYEAVSAGFTKTNLGSLLQSNKTFTGKHIESTYEIISSTIDKSITACKFRTYKGYFSDNINEADHSSWVKHYQEFGLNGIYFSKGKRRHGDFDLVLFGVIKGDDACLVMTELPAIVESFIDNLNDFAIVFENLRQNRKSVIEQATRAAISQVMARNMSHNIGSHVMSKFKDIKDFNFDINSDNNQYIGLNVK